jgi:hypothetical protein
MSRVGIGAVPSGSCLGGWHSALTTTVSSARTQAVLHDPAISVGGSMMLLDVQVTLTARLTMTDPVIALPEACDVIFSRHGGPTAVAHSMPRRGRVARQCLRVTRHLDLSLSKAGRAVALSMGVAVRIVSMIVSLLRVHGSHIGGDNKAHWTSQAVTCNTRCVSDAVHCHYIYTTAR